MLICLVAVVNCGVNEIFFFSSLQVLWWIRTLPTVYPTSHKVTAGTSDPHNPEKKIG